MDKERFSMLFVMMTFAVGAVVVIVYQHAAATRQITGALGGGSTGQGGSQAGFQTFVASLAGTPSIGMDGTSTAPVVVPTFSGPNWTLG